MSSPRRWRGFFFDFNHKGLKGYHKGLQSIYCHKGTKAQRYLYLVS